MTAPDLLQQDVALDALNTLRLPARAAWFAAVESADALRAVLDEELDRGADGQEVEGWYSISDASMEEKLWQIACGVAERR